MAALIVAFHFRTNLHAEYFVAELPFALVGVLFFGLIGPADNSRPPTGKQAGPSTLLTGLLAVATFLLRTAGVTLLAVWAAVPLRRRRFRQALARIGLAGSAVLAWQGYIAWVKQQPDYATPAYAYQTAPYMLYNIPYAEAIRRINPHRPEDGLATMTDLGMRVGFGLTELANRLGESVSIDRDWYAGEIAKLNRILGRELVPLWLSGAATGSLTLLIVGGFVLLAARGAWLITCYAAMTLFLLILFPAPGSLPRYIAPLAPLSAVALLAFLSWVPDRLNGSTRGGRLGRIAVATLLAIVLSQEAYTLRKIHRMLYYPADWVDSRGRQRVYAMYAFDRPWRLHTEALRWLRRVAAPGAIVATSTPHWAYLVTGLKSVQPPWEPDPATEEYLLESVPVTYLVIDQLSAFDPAASHRRYSLSVLQAFPSRWRLIYSAPDSGSRIYRRVNDTASWPAVPRHRASGGIVATRARVDRTSCAVDAELLDCRRLSGSRVP